MDPEQRRDFFALLTKLHRQDLALVQDAYWLAEDVFERKKRDNGDPAIVHPIGVAKLLIERGYVAPHTLCLGLLHDVIEDGFVPKRLIVCGFGETVWRDLNTLSKVTLICDPLTGALVRKACKPLDEYYAGIAIGSKRVRVVKLADKLHNQQTCEHWTDARKRKYALEARQYIQPIADRTDNWFADQIREATDVMDPGPAVAPAEPGV